MWRFRKDEKQVICMMIGAAGLVAFMIADILINFVGC
jgi:hypothetical protein